MNATKHRYAAAVGLILLIASPSWGQYRLGDGRALDRNLRQGSGGVNAPRRRNTAGQYQDAITTGNVGGLARFRGDINYRAAGEFSGPLASDTTYDFRRQSLPTVPVTRYQQQNAGGTGRNPLSGSGGRATALIRSGSGIDAGQVTGQRRLYEGALTVRRDDPIGSIGQRYDETLTYEDYQRGDRPDPRRSGREAAEPGRLLGVSASPLTGLRLQRFDGQPAGGAAGERGRQPAAEAGGASGLRSLTPTEAGRGGERAGASPASPPAPDQPNQAPGQFRRRSKPREAPPERMDSRVQASAEPSSRRLEERREGGRRTGREKRGETSDQAASSVGGRDQGFVNLEPGQDVYRDLLRRIRDERGSFQGTGDRPAARTDQSASADGSDRSTGSSPGAGGSASRGIDEIAERFRRERRETEDAAASEGNPPAPRNQAPRLEQLNYDLPPLQSLAGSAETAFNRFLVRAEQRMRSGRYFEAASLYEQAVSMRPDHPLAQVGRAHAQLAAGVFRAASENLRRLFREHPEIIAARYEQPILPPDDRLEEIRDQLETRLGSARRSGAPLLLAYLAYQRNQTDAVRDALDQMPPRKGGAPLETLLRQIWLSPSAGPSSGTGKGGTGPSDSAPSDNADARRGPAAGGRGDSSRRPEEVRASQPRP